MWTRINCYLNEVFAWRMLLAGRAQVWANISVVFLAPVFNCPKLLLLATLASELLRKT